MLGHENALNNLKEAAVFKIKEMFPDLGLTDDPDRVVDLVIAAFAWKRTIQEDNDKFATVEKRTKFD